MIVGIYLLKMYLYIYIYLNIAHGKEKPQTAILNTYLLNNKIEWKMSQ